MARHLLAFPRVGQTAVGFQKLRANTRRRIKCVADTAVGFLRSDKTLANSNARGPRDVKNKTARLSERNNIFETPIQGCGNFFSMLGCALRMQIYN